jgi:hypothetical protein
LKKLYLGRVKKTRIKTSNLHYDTTAMEFFSGSVKFQIEEVVEEVIFRWKISALEGFLSQTYY